MSPPSAAVAINSFREKGPEALFGEALPPASGEILKARIKDLKLHLSGTQLEKYIQRLYQELEAAGIQLKPECYLSDQWGCPSGVPVIGVPFYLADDQLHSIEATLGGGAESEQDIMMYLRHEAGHAFNYAYKLYETEEWKKLFGDFNRPYRDEYKPMPFSRKYVLHISGWYAQKHPDEDFAETFAVYLTPGSDWAARYKAWGCLKKLQYVQSAVGALGHLPAPVTLDEKDIEVDQMEETVLDHYRTRALEERVDVQLGDALDQDLQNLFEAPDSALARADTLLRAERQNLVHSISQYSGVSYAVVKSVYEHLLDRTRELSLSVRLDKSHEYMMRFTALLSTLSMNYLYTDKFFEVE